MSARRTLFLIATMLSVNLASGLSCPALSQEGDPAARVLTFTEVESMSDPEYWAYVYTGFVKVATGHAWGERLIQFLSMNASLASVQQIESTNARSQGNSFWVAIHPPWTSGLEYFYRDDLNALMIPRIPIDQVLAGVIFAHELQHAYDRLMSPDTAEIQRVNNTFVEMTAYVLAIELMDNYTEGGFSRTLQTILVNKEYKSGSGPLKRPDKNGRRRLEALFGPPSPWESKLRDTLYDIALSYSDCQNPVERSYATALLKGFDWIFGAPRYQHIGRDLTATVGEMVPSPVAGRVVSLVEPVRLRSIWRGLIIEGSGADEGRTVRILGIGPEVKEGDTVERGAPLGSTLNPAQLTRGTKPFLHVELYENGHREDPFELLQERWPARSDAHAFRWAEGNQQLRKALLSALEAERDRDYEKALRLFDKALPEPWYEATNSELFHYKARTLANLGRFEEAAEVQRLQIGLIDKELEYSKGAMPSLELGSVGYVFDEEYLSVYLVHMKANLTAYEGARNTIYVY